MKKVHYLQLKEINDQNLLQAIFIKVLLGQDIYKSIEEKAANFLYLIVKNHVFADGNKKIAAKFMAFYIKMSFQKNTKKYYLELRNLALF